MRRCFKFISAVLIICMLFSVISMVATAEEIQLSSDNTYTLLHQTECLQGHIQLQQLILTVMRLNTTII